MVLELRRIVATYNCRFCQFAGKKSQASTVHKHYQNKKFQKLVSSLPRTLSTFVFLSTARQYLSI